MTEKKKSVFETLSSIDTSGHIETIKMKKGPALKYLSWAWAWAMVKQRYPEAFYDVRSYPEFAYDEKEGKWYATGQQLDYRITPAGCEVKVRVHIEDENYIERLYVMDMRNRPVMHPTIDQINKTQKRCLVKALALAGLGLNIYAGEDLPMGDISQQDEKEAETKKKAQEEMDKYREEYNATVAKIAEKTGQNDDAVNQVIGGSLGQKPEFQQANRLDQWHQLRDFAKKMLKDTTTQEEKTNA